MKVLYFHLIQAMVTLIRAGVFKHRPGKLVMDQGYRFVWSAEDCASELTRTFYELWDELRGDQAAPVVSSFDYLHRPEFLARLIVFKVLPEPLDFEQKYFGSDLFRIFEKKEFKPSVMQVYDATRDNPATNDFVADSVAIVTTCHETGRPLLNGPKQINWVPKSFIRYESLTVPFVDTEGVVVTLATVVHFDLV